MGIFDRFSKKGKVEEAKEQSKKITEYSMPSLDGKNEILLYGITNQGKIRHRNQEITNLIMARITKYREGDTIYFDTSDYIAFELPLGQELNQEIIQTVIQQYDREGVRNIKKSPYLGRIEKRQEMYGFGNKSGTIENAVKNIIERSQKEREQQRKDSVQANEQREAQFRESIAKSASDYVETMRKIREERKAAPTIKQQGSYEIKGKTYTNYDGIDINTGDILRMRKVDKVGKDGSGTYLYTAYVSTTENEYDVELFDYEESTAFPVCFTLEKRLEDIVREGDAREINTLLTLLSNAGNFENREQLAYIGRIDRTGQIYWPNYSKKYYSPDNGSDREQFSSTAIGMKIQAMQKEYARQSQARREQRGRGE